jgi:hypothetical protein
MSALIAPQAGGCDVEAGVSPAILPGDQMLGCASEVPSLSKGKAIDAGEGLRSIAPHLKAAVIAAATLAIESSGTMFDNRFMGHGGLLYDKGSPLRLKAKNGTSQVTRTGPTSPLEGNDMNKSTPKQKQ